MKKFLLVMLCLGLLVFSHVIGEDGSNNTNSGSDLYMEGKYLDALKAFESAIQLDTSNAELYQKKAQCLVQLNRFKEALVAVNKSLALNPQLSSAETLQTEILLKLKPQSSSSTSGKAETQINSSNNSERKQELVKQGIELSKQFLDDDAITLFNQAIEIDPNYAEAWFNKGNSLSALGKEEKAIEAYDQAIKINPKYVEALNGKGNSLSALGESVKAIETFDQAIKIDPSYAEAFINKGSELTNLDKFLEANEVFDQAIQIKPEDAFTWSMKSASLSSLGRYNEAIDAADKAIQYQYGGEQPWLVKADALLKLGRYQESLDVCDETLKKDPKSSLVQIAKGAALIKLEKYPDAIDFSEKSIQDNPKSSGLWKNKAIAENYLEQYGTALEDISVAIALEDHLAVVPTMNIKRGESYFIKATSLAGLKKVEEARKAIQQAIQLNPDNQEYQKFLSNMSKF